MRLVFSESEACGESRAWETWELSMYQVLKRQKWLKPAEFANQMCRILTMCAIACLQSSSAPFPPSRFDAVSICPCSTDPTSNLYCVGDECLLCKMLRSPHAITDKNYAPYGSNPSDPIVPFFRPAKLLS